MSFTAQKHCKVLGVSVQNFLKTNRQIEQRYFFRKQHRVFWQIGARISWQRAVSIFRV